MSIVPDTGQWGAYFARLKAERKELEIALQDAIGPIQNIGQLSDQELRRLARTVNGAPQSYPLTPGNGESLLSSDAALRPK